MAASRHRPCPLLPTGFHVQGSFRVSASSLVEGSLGLGFLLRPPSGCQFRLDWEGGKRKLSVPGAEDTSQRVSAVIFAPRGLILPARGPGWGGGGGRLAGPLGSQTFASFLLIHHNSLFRRFLDTRDACPFEGIRALWLGQVLSGPDFSAAEEEPTKGRCPRGPSEIRVAGEGAGGGGRKRQR